MCRADVAWHVPGTCKKLLSRLLSRPQLSSVKHLIWLTNFGPYGACTVHIDGKAVRSCQTQMSSGRQEGHDHRRAVAELQSRAAEGLDRRAGAAMRLLPVRSDHASGGTAGEEQKADAQADHRPH